MFQNELQGTMDKLEKTDENLSAIVNKAYIIAAQNDELAVQASNRLAWLSCGR